MTRVQVGLRCSFAFDIDMQHGPNCGAGEPKIITAIPQRPAIEKILTHLLTHRGLDPQPPPRTPACEPRRQQARRAAAAVRRPV
jgi:hypothetical protein